MTVQDTTPPDLTVPDSFTIEGNTTNGANTLEEADDVLSKFQQRLRPERVILPSPVQDDLWRLLLEDGVEGAYWLVRTWPDGAEKHPPPRLCSCWTPLQQAPGWVRLKRPLGWLQTCH